MSAMRSLGPAPGFRGRVVGRVAEVECNGVRGCTRRPVLDFRPTGGVSVAARAAPATSMCPPFDRSRPAGWQRPGLPWVDTNGGLGPGCPQCGVWLGPGIRERVPIVGGVGLVVRNAESVSGPGLSCVGCWSSGGGRVHRCARVYSTTGTRLPPRSNSSSRQLVLPPRPVCAPLLTGRAPPGVCLGPGI